MSAALDRDRLVRCLGGESWRWLRLRLRRPLADGLPVPARVRLADPDEGQRAAAEALLGRRLPGPALTLAPAEILAVLSEARIADDWKPALEALDGPLPLGVRQVEAAWSAFQARVVDALGGEAAERLRATGLWPKLSARDVDQSGVWLTTLTDLARLLRRDGWLLPVLAARATGDAHALDRGSPLSALALRAFAGADDAGAGWRAGWEGLGVRTDRLSASALALGLRPIAGRLSSAIAAHAQAGEPVRLTARLLRAADAPRFALAGTVVRVCENPAVVQAAADRWGSACPPLVCSEGQPSGAVVALIAALRAGGARFAYHGDFDWAGLVIAGQVLANGDAPWRYDASAYRAALVGGVPTLSLRGEPVTATWDPALTTAMIASGRAIHEEAVLGDLLADLGPAPG